VLVDHRDEPSWVVLSLTRLGEQKVEDGTLVSSLLRDLNAAPEHPVFVPSVTYRKGRRHITVHLMEGYVFVASGLPDVVYFALEQRPYIEQVMATPPERDRPRNLAVIPDEKIRNLKAQLQERVASDIQVGEVVRICEGQYRKMEGIVTGMDGSDAHVFIKLRSLQVVATVPRVFLESVDCENFEDNTPSSV
jgi:transcription antitermination factor NusG